MKPHYKERFLRNIGIMNEAELEKIQATTVAIGGLGVGGSIFIDLVRMGFQKFHISDPDTYERTNINRQRLAKESTIGTRKDRALIAEAFDINPDVQIKSFGEGINKNNVSEFLTGVNWVVDVVDVFALGDKLALNAEAAKRKLPTASCGAVGFACSVVVFDQTTPTFAELTGMSEDDPYEVNIQKFVQFICPEVPPYLKAQLDKALKREGHIPFIAPGVEIVAAFAAAEIGKDILKLGEPVRAPTGIHIDAVKLEIQKYNAFHAGYRARDAGKKAA